MRRALRLAEKARGWTLPNPMVGALIMKDGKRIGEGYHSKFGEAHAEVEALKNCTESPEGATLYVTLEPCCHTGKTPPCTDAILKSGIQKVIIATLDPSEKMNGKGAQILRDAGIEVELGLLKEEARELNRDFFIFHRQKRPFITLKAALSLDCKISNSRDEETPLTGEKAQKQVHLLRHLHQAILVGSGTVLADDPHLGVRLIEGRSPLRIILEGKRKLPKNAKVFRDENFLILKEESLPKILNSLYEQGIVSVLVEGGHEVFTSFLEAGIVDEFKLFFSPQFLGEKALPFAALNNPIALHKISLQEFGKDFLLTAKLEKSSTPHENTKTNNAESEQLKDQISVSKALKKKNGKSHKESRNPDGEQGAKPKKFAETPMKATLKKVKKEKRI